MAWRFAMLLALAALIWRLPALVERTVRWLAASLVVVIAAAIAAAGHGSASGPLDLGIVTLHVLTAGIWVGGLVVLVVLGRTVSGEAVRRFATLAMTSVIILVATGILNSLRSLHSHRPAVPDPVRPAAARPRSRWSLATLGAAAVSRAWVRRDRLPRGSVRLEAGLTVAVLTVTAFLSMTSPPPQARQPPPPARPRRRRPRLRERARPDVVGPPRLRRDGHHPGHHHRQPAAPPAHRRRRAAAPGHRGRAQGQQPRHGTSGASRCR